MTLVTDQVLLTVCVVARPIAVLACAKPSVLVGLQPLSANTPPVLPTAVGAECVRTPSHAVASEAWLLGLPTLDAHQFGLGVRHVAVSPLTLVSIGTEPCVSALLQDRTVTWTMTGLVAVATLPEWTLVELVACVLLHVRVSAGAADDVLQSMCTHALLDTTVRTKPAQCRVAEGLHHRTTFVVVSKMGEILLPTV